jgi:hypothetical protein
MASHLSRFILVGTSFTSGRLAGRNDAQEYIGGTCDLIGMRHRQKLAARIEPKREPALFVLTISFVVEVNASASRNTEAA